MRLGAIKDNYAIVYLPAIGNVKIYNSRDLKIIQEIRTVTVKREGGNWYMSMLVDIPSSPPEDFLLTECKSVVGIDVGINKLVAVYDGS